MFAKKTDFVGQARLYSYCTMEQYNFWYSLGIAFYIEVHVMYRRVLSTTLPACKITMQRQLSFLKAHIDSFSGLNEVQFAEMVFH